MKVKIQRRGEGSLSLVVADAAINKAYDATNSQPIELACLINFFGSGVYSLSDVRLSKYERVSPYLEGGVEIYKPKNVEEREFLQSVLHTYDERGDTFSWNTFDINYFDGDNPERKDKYGEVYTSIARFSYKEANERLQDIKTFWEKWSNPDLNLAKINNPHRQLSSAEVFGELYLRREMQKQKKKKPKI